MSEYIHQLLQLPHILFIIFGVFTFRIAYASHHFAGSSKSANGVLTIVGAVYSLCLLACLVLEAIKEGVVFAIILLATLLILNIIENRIRNKIVMARFKRDYNSPIENENDKMIAYSLFSAKSDIAITYISWIGVIVNIPILIYLTLHIIKLFK